METWGGPLVIAATAVGGIFLGLAMKRDTPVWFVASWIVWGCTSAAIGWDGSLLWAACCVLWFPALFIGFGDHCRRSMHGHPTLWSSLWQRQHSLQRDQ